MNAGDKNFATSSDTTSPAKKRAERQSESEFLAAQSADAKQAVLDSIDELKDSLAQAADYKVWTRQHPWAAVGIAAVAGFAAATVITPRPEQTMEEKLASL